MIHYMNLQNSPFELIKKGDKTIEMRLNDEKRRLVKVGDVIQFKNIVSDETINCNVINLYNYNTFNELYENHDKKSIGYLDNEVANPDDMLEYYSLEKINKYKVLAIEVKVI